MSTVEHAIVEALYAERAAISNGLYINVMQQSMTLYNLREKLDNERRTANARVATLLEKIIPLQHDLIYAIECNTKLQKSNVKLKSALQKCILKGTTLRSGRVIQLR